MDKQWTKLDITRLTTLIVRDIKVQGHGKVPSYRIRRRDRAYFVSFVLRAKLFQCVHIILTGDGMWEWGRG